MNVLSRRARSLLTVVGWLATAAGAATVGTFVVGAASSSILGGTTVPLSQDQVTRALAAATANPTVPSATSGPAQGTTRALGTPGGSVIARCSDDQVTLVSWSPAQGYDTDDVWRGPATTASLTFENYEAELDVQVTCRAGVPVARTDNDTDSN
ncbi:hypothetical protein ACWDWO_27130 [Actinopolymorpha singaporensis]|uniref:Septum formation initiator n=1 Tax=Actinopolymorpha singaporensis TaxID=117157 RepID=A0A1H1TWJ9_9ACTN|nr:hypothetical protein [Actinopolymorpha singaporensis]SDS64607.1 hypothetical protein SAMN04489717_3370 [Actinopolymorpha singaporensis]